MNIYKIVTIMHITIRFQLQIFIWINIGLKIGREALVLKLYKSNREKTVTSYFAADTEKSGLIGSGGR